jgi:hypothetical protein
MNKFYNDWNINTDSQINNFNNLNDDINKMFIHLFY